MKKPTKVRFIVAWQRYRVGDVITPPAMHRGWLLQNGYVEIVRPTEDLETATALGPAENAAARVSAPTRKGGRPRKIRT